MRIDWKAVEANPDPLALYDAVVVGPDIDWTDPTHVPCMVADAVEKIGNLSECLSDEEHVALCVVAIDAMPRGRDAVTRDVQERCRALAFVNGWSDYLLEPHTGRYPWEPEDTL